MVSKAAEGFENVQDDCLFLPGRDKKLGFYYSTGDRARLKEDRVPLGRAEHGTQHKGLVPGQAPKRIVEPQSTLLPDLTDLPFPDHSHA